MERRRGRSGPTTTTASASGGATARARSVCSRPGAPRRTAGATPRRATATCARAHPVAKLNPLSVALRLPPDPQRTDSFARKESRSTPGGLHVWWYWLISLLIALLCAWLCASIAGSKGYSLCCSASSASSSSSSRSSWCWCSRGRRRPERVGRPAPAASNARADTHLSPPDAYPDQPASTPPRRRSLQTGAGDEAALGGPLAGARLLASARPHARHPQPAVGADHREAAAPTSTTSPMAPPTPATSCAGSGWAAKTWSTSPAQVVQAPGEGSQPRTRSYSRRQGLPQSRRALPSRKAPRRWPAPRPAGRAARSPPSPGPRPPPAPRRPSGTGGRSTRSRACRSPRSACASGGARHPCRCRRRARRR